VSATVGEVVTWVSGRVAEDRHREVEWHFSAAIEGGLPPGILQTMLIRDGDEVSIVTTWQSREDLAAMQASGQEPLARRLIREAGGSPTLRVFDVAVRR